MLALGCCPGSARANTAGGIIPGSPNVTVVDNGDNTVTMANGIVAITLFKDYDEIHTIKYTFTSGGGSQTVDTIVTGSHGRDRYSWGGFPLSTGGPNTYTLATDPASNGGNYADVKFVSEGTGTNGVLETHYSMLRGSPGFYTTGIMSHRSQDAASSVGAFGLESTVTPNFNWVSQDAARNRFLTGLLRRMPGRTPGLGFHTK